MNTNPITIPTLADALAISADMKGTFIIKGDLIGPANLVKWQNALGALQRASYDLKKYENDHALSNSVGFNPAYLVHLQDEQEQVANEIIAMIGRVNGAVIRDVAPIIKSADQWATFKKDVYHGEALTLKEEMGELSKLIKEAEGTNGINPEYLDGLKKSMAVKDARMKVLATIPGMITNEPNLTKPETFRKKFEHDMGKIITGQKMLSYEQIKALEDQKKAEKKAKRKAKRQAEAQARDAQKK